jgi:hypothetical protein
MVNPATAASEFLRNLRLAFGFSTVIFLEKDGDEWFHWVQLSFSHRSKNGFRNE